MPEILKGLKNRLPGRYRVVGNVSAGEVYACILMEPGVKVVIFIP
jgi:hypothetical protein